MVDRAVIVGNSDGIGLALTQLLLERGWVVSGLSRSPSPVEHAMYQHTIADVRGPEFLDALRRTLEVSDTRLVIYCAGIGEAFDPSRLSDDVATFETNLMGFVRAVECALPHFIVRKAGTIVGLSSMIDVLRSKASPAYSASKAGMSRYAESVSLAIRDTGVNVVNVRLGFVITKMAKAAIKPWVLEPEEVAGRILRRVLSASPPARLNIPRRMAVLVALAQLFVGRL